MKFKRTGEYRYPKKGEWFETENRGQEQASIDYEYVEGYILEEETMSDEKTEKYEITGDAIRKMAEACPTAKSVLEAGFPDAFKKKEPKEEWVDVTPQCTYESVCLGLEYFIRISHSGRQVTIIDDSGFSDKWNHVGSGFRLIKTPHNNFRIEKRV